ncbi:hypothetical protein PISL3812_02081 [Talaromyces islandicus]|uniref:HMG box domain-containing protein n=1 Tax=Talaromyces islandicus TaxID=28573 RepID=A0A0U1LR57_TALIS|nr:hypothetical protein PISL3812_02081 [Talaromyces islandicus]
MLARCPLAEADNDYHIVHTPYDPSSRMSSSSSRMGARSAAYLPPPTFSPDVGSMAPLQVDEGSQYTATPELSSESDLLPDPSNNPILFEGDYSQPPASANSRVRVLKAPRVRRRTRPATTDKAPNLVIDKPLSVLTKHLKHIPLKDMKKWANRDAYTRLQEVAEKNGKIARPMNSFMLYRSAYAERTKEWCRKNNHQVVSRVSGQSWPMEPPEIREEYELLALIERDNHQKAHPNYKFAPNKTQTPPRRKRPLADEGSEAEEGEVHGPIQSSPMSGKRVRPSGLSSSFTSRDSTPLDSHEPLLDTYQPSAWQLPSGRPMGAPLYPSTETGYFMAHANMTRAADQGHPASGPGPLNSHYGTSASLVGIPGGVHQELVRSYPSGHAANRLEDSQLDPQLLSSDVAGGDLRSFSWPNFTFRHTEQDLAPYFRLAGNNMGYEAMSGFPGGPGIDDSGIWTGCEDGLSEVSKDLEGWLQPSTGYPS